jgi:ABC-type cobalamin/Fe3+-siderophores transport system ATPase subunit
VGNLTLRGVRIAIAERTLLEPFDLNIATGSFAAIVGPNGVGKTTLLRAIAGFETPASGTVALDGRDLRSFAANERARAIAALGADAEAPHGMTVREVALCGRFAQRPWWQWTRADDDLTVTEAALARVGLADSADRLFDTLSSGERQRAWIALALAQGARVLLLDEPTSHLDARYAREILALLRGIASGGTTVVAVLHDLNEASSFADRIAIFGDRRLLAYDAPATALASATLEAAYGIAFARAEIDGETRVFARLRGDS